jgi:hypothetical protein
LLSIRTTHHDPPGAMESSFTYLLQVGGQHKSFSAAC